MAVKNDETRSIEPIVWLDFEMTGLILDEVQDGNAPDEIIEIGIYVTGPDLTPLDPDGGLNIVVKPSAAAMKNLLNNSYVLSMHKSSGLFDELENGVSIHDADLMVVDYLKRFVNKGKSPLGGNTISMDRRFVSRYMPLLDGYLHYRSIDVSGIKEVLRRWHPYVIDAMPPKTGNHRALPDAKDSLREMKYYQELLLHMEVLEDEVINRAVKESEDYREKYLK